jgi:sirohydrochlorin ferrochelatase
MTALSALQSVLRRAFRSAGVGFIKGEAGDRRGDQEARRANIVVYPLFLGAGYFSRTVLGRAVEEMCKKDYGTPMA